MALNILRTSSRKIQIGKPIFDLTNLTVPFEKGASVGEDEFGWYAERVPGSGHVCNQCVNFPEWNASPTPVSSLDICRHCFKAHSQTVRYIKKK